MGCLFGPVILMHVPSWKVDGTKRYTSITANGRKIYLISVANIATLAISPQIHSFQEEHHRNNAKIQLQ